MAKGRREDPVQAAWEHWSFPIRNVLPELRKVIELAQQERVRDLPEMEAIARIQSLAIIDIQRAIRDISRAIGYKYEEE